MSAVPGRLAVVSRPGVAYPGGEDGFSPDERYPEYAFATVSGRPNPVYAMVRALFRDAGLDAARFGQADWNPLGGLIAPGASVFVLCNFVYHRRPEESAGIFHAKCIHGSVLRALVDYILIATGPGGRVRFGNSALQSCQWRRVLEDTGAARVLEFYRGQGAPVEACDLRLFVAHRDALGRVEEVDRRDDSVAAVDIDLSADSLLGALNRAGAPRFRISDYDPRRIERFHADGAHHYVINRAILDSDVVFSLSKLKTHEKVGITCGLKGFVGTVGHKDCLAHHRYGGPGRGGDEYPRGLGVLPAISAFHDWINTRPREAPLQGLFQFTERAVRSLLRRAGITMAGAWHGNDTAWRMTLDLARVVHYADRSGVMRETPQRRHLSLIDGIVAGEGEGPLAPEPVPAGTLVFGESVADADRLAARLMGFDPDAFPLLRDPGPAYRYPLPRDGDARTVCVNGEERPLPAVAPVAGRAFRPPHGWRGHVGARR